MLGVIAMLVAISGGDAAVPKSAAEAVAIADAHPGRGTRGVYRIVVAAGRRTPSNVYLNTADDYNAPDDVTVQLSPLTARAIEKRIGGRPEVALVGRTITVRGIVRAMPIADTFGGRPRSLNRYQHTIFVQDENQISVE